MNLSQTLIVVGPSCDTSKGIVSRVLVYPMHGLFREWSVDYLATTRVGSDDS